MTPDLANWCYTAPNCIDTLRPQGTTVQITDRFKNPWWVVFGATLGMVVGNTPITLYTFGLFIGPVTSEFGWSNSTFAVAFFLTQVAGAVGMPFVGRWVDKYGMRPLTLLSVVVFSLSTALLSQTRSFIPFLLLYVVSGLAGAGRGTVSYPKAISIWFHSRRGLALGIAYAGLGIGAAVVPHVARLMIDHFGWRNAYIGLGMITFVIAFPTVALFIREPKESTYFSASPAGSEMQSVSHIPSEIAQEGLKTSLTFWILMAGAFLTSLSLTGTLTHVVPLLAERGISTKSATSIVSLVGIASIGGRLLGGYLLDRFFAAYVASSFFLLGLMGIMTLDSAPVLGGLCLGLSMGAQVDTMIFLASRYFALHRFGETLGWIIAISVLGNGAGPWLMAVCHDFANSYRVALVGFGWALVATAIFVLRLGPYRYPTAGTVGRLVHR